MRAASGPIALFAALGVNAAPGIAPAAAPAATATEPATDEDQPASSAPTQPTKPPRVDGVWVGAVGYATAAFVRVNDLQTDGPFAGFGGAVRVGQMVFPWFGLGLQLGGALAVRSGDEARQRVGAGTLLVDLQFVPAPRIPLSLRTSFGFGGGAVRQAGVSGREGFGGAMFSGAVRYELFPGVRRYRPDRGGGFGLGPELGWIGATPAAPGRPMANFVYLGLAGNFYFGS